MNEPRLGLSHSPHEGQSWMGPIEDLKEATVPCSVGGEVKKMGIS